MKKKRQTKKRQQIKKEKSKMPLLLIFFFIIILTVISLDYLSFKKNKKSSLFSNKKSSQKHKKQDFLMLLNNLSSPYSSFKDKKGLRHFKIETKPNLKQPLIKSINDFCKKNNLALIKMDSKNKLELYKIQENDKDKFFILISDTITTKKKVAKTKPKLIVPQKTKIIKQNEIAIIIDDIGSYSLGAKEFSALNIPITLSVLIDSKFAKKEIQLLKELKNIETIVHLPMQAKGEKLKDCNKNITITTHSSAKDIDFLIKRSKKAIPFAKGVNNHQGSLLTSNYFSTRIVIKKLKENNLFFVDSKTSAKSVGYKIAKEEGVPSAQRDVFLDHEVDFDYTCQQIVTLVQVAKKQGHAIAIGHPHPSTYKAIKKMLPYIKKNSIKLVRISQLLIY